MLSASLLLVAAMNSAAPAAADSLPPHDEAAAPATIPAAKTDPAYERTIEKRARDMLAALHVDDPVKAARVRGAIVDHYRALNAWHDANDARLGIRYRNAEEKKTPRATPQEAQHAEAELKALHDRFLSRLAADLTPEQIEQVKDKMTYGKVAVTYNGYLQIVPGLTEAEKAKILALLKDAREEAMDGGSEKEKSAVFNKYKGKIANFLNADGHDVAKAYKEWGERPKEKAAQGPASQPAAEKTAAE